MHMAYAHMHICYMHAVCASTKNETKNSSSRSSWRWHTTTVVGPYSMAFSRLFILFSISMGLAFCIDETINELIMTNDQGSQRSLSLLLCGLFASRKWQICACQCSVSDHNLINEECTFVICNGCEHIRTGCEWAITLRIATARLNSLLLHTAIVLFSFNRNAHSAFMRNCRRWKRNAPYNFAHDAKRKWSVNDALSAKNTRREERQRERGDVGGGGDNSDGSSLNGV